MDRSAFDITCGLTRPTKHIATRSTYVIIAPETDPRKQRQASLPVRPARPPEPLWDKLPVALTVRPQWVVWAYLYVNGRWTKVPFQPDGTWASSTDATTWARFEDAQCAYFAECAEREIPFDGVGFVLSVDDPFTGFDFDHSLDADRMTDPKIEDYVCRLDSYTEISPSGTGLR